MSKRCSTGKVRYSDREEANDAMKEVSIQKRVKNIIRFYFCKKCHGFHLTSRL